MRSEESDAAPRAIGRCRTYQETNRAESTGGGGQLDRIGDDKFVGHMLKKQRRKQEKKA